MVIVTRWTSAEVQALMSVMGMSQTEFARAAGVTTRTVRRWESGQPIGPQGQADLGGLLARLDPDAMNRFAAQLGREEDDQMDRRSLFKVAALGAAAAAGVDLPALVHGGGEAGETAVAALRQSLHAAMVLDDQLGSPAASGMVQVQTALTRALLEDCSPDQRRPLMVLHAEWVGLGGCLEVDRGQFEAAASMYEQAREIAHDAEDSDLAAYMLCHLSQLATWQGRRRFAQDHAAAAHAWIRDSRDARLRGYVLMLSAWAAANVGHERDALRALDDAQAALAGLGPCPPSASRAYHTDDTMLAAYRGAVLAALGRTAEGAAAMRAAAEQMPSPRDQAVTLIESAEASVLAGDIDRAAAAIGTAAERTTRNRSPRLARRVMSARHQLAPWAASQPVRELDDHLVDMVRP